MNNEHKKLLGVCGLYCGACDNYLAFTESGQHLLKTEKYIGKDLEPLMCKGCSSNALSDHCCKCEMRKCAQSKGISFCGACESFPCEKVTMFHAEGHKWDKAKHRLDIIKNSQRTKTIGVDEWLKESEKKWTCKCGQHFSFYESECSKCNKSLKSYSKK